MKYHWLSLSFYVMLICLVQSSLSVYAAVVEEEISTQKRIQVKKDALNLNIYFVPQTGTVSLTQSSEKTLMPQNNFPVKNESVSPQEDTSLKDEMRALSKKYLEIEKENEELEQEVKEAFRDSTSYISLGMTTLGVIAGTLALLGVSITLISYFNHKKFLSEIKEEQTNIEKCSREIASLLDTTKKGISDFEENFLKKKLTEKIDEETIHEANEKIKDMTQDGRDTLLALAIQAKDKEEWEDAYTFWKALAKIDKNDSVLFYYALSCCRLFDKRGELIQDEHLLKEALSTFDAISNASDDAAVLANLGLTYSNYADIKEKLDKKKRLWEKAEEKYAEAIRIAPDMDATWYNWGNLLSERAELAEEIEEKNKLWSEAEEKYAEAVRITPTNENIWNNWGNLLSNRAERAEEIEEKKKLWDEAGEKYMEAVRITPTMDVAWNNWGSLLLKRTESAEEAEVKSKLWNEAKLKLEKVIELDPTDYDAYYNLACYEALFGKLWQCLAYLVQCKKLDYPHLQQRISKDKDFDKVRNAPEFKEFLTSLNNEAIITISEDE